MNSERKKICDFLSKPVLLTTRLKLIQEFFDIQEELQSSDILMLKQVVTIPEFVLCDDSRVSAAFKYNVFVQQDGLLMHLINDLNIQCPEISTKFCKAFLYTHMLTCGLHAGELQRIFTVNKELTDKDITNINNMFTQYVWTPETVFELYNRGATILDIYKALKHVQKQYYGQVQFNNKWVKTKSWSVQQPTVKHLDLHELPTVFHIDKTLFSPERSWKI